jgi:site-specific DNA recombinase
MDKIGIGALSISVLSVLYVVSGGGSLISFMDSFPSIVHLLHIGGDGLPLVFLAGLNRREDIDGTRCVLIERISDGGQSDTSLDKQSEDLHEEVEELGGTVVREFKGAESGASMNRDSLEEVLQLARADKFDILMVWKVDRLTRANPWESFEYLNDLKKNDVTLYSDSHGYFQWNENYDFRRLIQDVVFARQWYKRIEEGRIGGCKQKLEDGKWPFGHTPFGYRLDEDRTIHLIEAKEDILESIFRTYNETENRSETRRRINERLREEFDQELSDTRIKTVLESDLCRGKLTLDGDIISEDSDLAVIDDECFKETQRILERRSNRVDALDLPDPIMRSVSNYGVEMMHAILPSVYFRRCRKCGGELERNGTTERNRLTLKNFCCTDCDYQGPLLSEKDLQKIHQTLPLRCPFCPESNHFEVKQLDPATDRYRYTCKICEESFATNAPPDEIERALGHPELAFSLDRELDMSNELLRDAEGERKAVVDDNQTDLTEFSRS